MPFFLGVDAGGTSSKARLTDEHGTVLGETKGGPANTRIGLEALHATLMDVCAKTVEAAGMNSKNFAQIRCGMGIAGINRMGMKLQIQSLEFPFANIQFSSDAMIANLGAHMGGDGAILILGTGWADPTFPAQSGSDEGI